MYFFQYYSFFTVKEGGIYNAAKYVPLQFSASQPLVCVKMGQKSLDLRVQCAAVFLQPGTTLNLLSPSCFCYFITV
jgi:hypothetical protein